MSKKDFIIDYLDSAKLRLNFSKRAISLNNYSYVVRECQEVAELCSKSLLLRFNFVVPKKHNLSFDLYEIKEMYSKEFQNKFKKIKFLLNKLRNEREISFYGDEDEEISPSKLYTKEEAETYLKQTNDFYNLVLKELNEYINNEDK